MKMNHIHKMPRKAPTGRTRDPDAKRAALHDAALELFAASGFESVSVADIAKRADVAVGTVYRLYPNKVALLQSLHAAMEMKFVNCVDKAWYHELPFEKRVRHLIEELLELIGAERSRLSILSMTTDVLYEDGSLPGDLVRKKIAEVICQDPDCADGTQESAAMTAAILHGAVEGAMRQVLREPDKATHADILKVLSNIMASALRRRLS